MLKHLYRHVGSIDSLFSLTRYIPRPILRTAASFVARRAVAELRQASFPHHLTYFVTNRCNLKCAHCFYASELNQTEGELDRKEIGKTAQSLNGHLCHVVFTGGEPTARNDFKELAVEFVTRAGLSSCTIMSNGTMPDKLIEASKHILDKTNASISYQISIDGPQTVHDSNRGIPGSLAKALRSLDVLADLRRNNPRIQRITTATAIGTANAASLPETLEILRELDGVACGFTFVRGSKHSTSAVSTKLLSEFDPSEEHFLNANEMDEAIRTIDQNYWNQRSVSLYHATNRAMLKLIARCTRDGMGGTRCMAGTADLTLYPNGDVALCEMIKPYANLRDHDFDFPRLQAEAFPKMKNVVANCRCTHDCNIASQFKFSPDHLYSLLLEGKTDSGQ